MKRSLKKQLWKIALTTAQEMKQAPDSVPVYRAMRKINKRSQAKYIAKKIVVTLDHLKG